jgi:hypothetical protein
LSFSAASAFAASGRNLLFCPDAAGHWCDMAEYHKAAVFYPHKDWVK